MRCSTIMARYNCMQRLLIVGVLVVLVAAVAWSQKSFTTRGADQYRAKQEQAEVVVGVKPYRVEKDVKAAFGKAKPYKHGVLPVLVVITIAVNTVWTWEISRCVSSRRTATDLNRFPPKIWPT